MKRVFWTLLMYTRVKASLTASSLVFIATACGVFGTDDCVPPPITGVELQPEKVTITQGVWGQISFWEGDFTPGRVCGRGTVTPARRVVLLYEPTLGSQTTTDSSEVQLITAISTSVIDSVWSDTTGFFEIAAPTGEYSVFVREEGLLYSAYGGSSQTLHTPVTVSPGEAAVLELPINYLATY